MLPPQNVSVVNWVRAESVEDDGQGAPPKVVIPAAVERSLAGAGEQADWREYQSVPAVADALGRPTDGPGQIQPDTPRTAS